VFNLKLPEIIRNSISIHPYGFTFDFILDGRTRHGRLDLTVVAMNDPFNLVIRDPASMADCMDHLALAVRGMRDGVSPIDIPLS
jgi:hypothetical protein